MKTTIRFCIGIHFCMLFFALSAHAKSAMPSYKDVVTKYCNIYDFHGKQGYYEARFEKRDIGWVVVLKAYDYKLSNQEIFWSKEEGNYRMLTYDLARNSKDNKDYKEKMLDSYNLFTYDINPYYGYVGWEMDVMSLLGSKTKMNDNELCALGRAYSSYAANLLNDNTGYSDSSKRYNLRQGTWRMNTLQLAEYRKYEHLSSSTYERLEKQNPNYHTFVGTMHTQVGNQFMVPYLNLLVYSTEEEAVKELKDSLYSPFIINFAKNTLNTCAPGAILFVTGDNVTYPLLYVQSKYGVRKDVRVVNIDLFATGSYINAMRKKHLDVPGVPLSLPQQAVYMNEHYDQLVPGKGGQLKLALDALLSTILADSSKGSYASFMQGVYTLAAADGKQIELQLNEQKLEKNQLAILDLLATDKLKTPIYFADAARDSYYPFVKNYIMLQGVASMVVTEENRKSTDYVDAEICYQNLMDRYVWEGVKNLKFEEARICMSHLIVFGKLADNLIENGQQDKATALLNKCMAIFPNNIMPAGIYHLRLAAAYYKLKKYADGAKIFENLLNNYFKPPSEDFKLLYTDNSEDQRAAIANYIRPLAQEANQLDLVRRCEKILMDYQKKRDNEN